MSEYQYYAFLTIDRPLSSAERQAVGHLSSHIDVSAMHASVEYSWGDFKHDPLVVLATYFDAFLYMANWGKRRLAFRFPQGSLTPQQLAPYRLDDWFTFSEIDGIQILDMEFDDEEGENGWIEGEGLIDSLASLRADLLQGDLRSLYIGWLAAASRTIFEEGDEESGDADDGIGIDDIDNTGDALDLEPPVPPGLRQLTAALQDFSAFLGIDQDLLAAAAEASPPLAKPSTAEPFERWLHLLPASEQFDFLLRLVRGEPLLGAKLQRRLCELEGAPAASPAAAGSRRKYAEIEAGSQAAQRQREAQERALAAQRRQQHLAALAQREASVWDDIHTFLQSKSGHAYDAVTESLVDLRDLAIQRKDRATFDAKGAELAQTYHNRPKFIERLRAKGLIRS